MTRYMVGQVVQLKKTHPCGSDLWLIIRVGMDFRIKCQKCGRSILLPRARFEKKMKQVVTDVQE